MLVPRTRAIRAKPLKVNTEPLPAVPALEAASSSSTVTCSSKGNVSLAGADACHRGATTSTEGCNNQHLTTTKQQLCRATCTASLPLWTCVRRYSNQLSSAAGAHQGDERQVEALEGAVAQVVTLGSDLHSSRRCQDRTAVPWPPLCNDVLRHTDICHGGDWGDGLRQEVPLQCGTTQHHAK